MGLKIKALLYTYHTREAWLIIQCWYRKSKYHLLPTTREGLENISAKREDLYRHQPP